ncbi:Uncharacterised protein [uncultured archaeon]|nr:Uncharacterised protein [uncultured archaeon]
MFFDAGQSLYLCLQEYVSPLILNLSAFNSLATTGGISAKWISSTTLNKNLQLIQYHHKGGVGVLCCNESLSIESTVSSHAPGSRGMRETAMSKWTDNEGIATRSSA